MAKKKTKQNQKKVLILAVALIALLGIFFLLQNFNSQSSVNNNQQSVNLETDSNKLESELIGIKLILPAGWTSKEKDEGGFGQTAEFEQKDSRRKLTIIKNHVGGVAGFKEYRPTEKTTLNGNVVDKSFLTENSNPETVSMFISTNVNDNKYLVIGNWKIGDTEGEKEINQILETLEFK